VNVVGKLDEGNLHVQFDEGALETGLGDRLRHRHRAKAAGNSYSPSLRQPRQCSTLLVVCCQFRADALRVQEALRKRLGKCGLTLEPAKTKLVEFGRFAQRHASKRGRRRPETIAFLGFTRYCTQNHTGNFKVGLRTEKSRLQRSLAHLRDLMRRVRHFPVREQVSHLNQVLRGHDAYYGIAGNVHAVQRVHRAVERYWYTMLCSRSRKGHISWEVFHRIKARWPLQRPRLRLPSQALQSMAVL
jgi:RNA-directed DNA polymerase